MVLLTPVAEVPAVSVPWLVADVQLRAVIAAAAAETVRASVQLCPPKLSAKFAVPAPLGVPVMLYVTLPAPEANDPAVRVAVRPVIPVEATLCALYAPPLPPV